MIHTYEGIYEHGAVRLPDDVQLPEHTKVYVIVPAASEPFPRVSSPRLAHPHQAADFVKEVVEEDFDATLR